MSSLWYILQDHTKYVYHYTKATTLTQHILPTRRFRFSKNVNDPREAREWRLGFIFRGPAEPVSAKFEEGLNNALKWSWRVGCFVSDPPEAVGTTKREEEWGDVIEAMYERGHSRPQMWSHYGQEYAGACLVFERDNLDAEIKREAGRRLVYSGVVEYRNPQIVPSLHRPHALILNLDKLPEDEIDEAVTKHIDQHQRELFFLKSRDWQNEREYRWVVKLDEPEDFYINLDAALVGILLGDRFPRAEKHAVASYCRSGNVQLGIMGWSNGVPQPEPTHWRLLTAGS